MSNQTKGAENAGEKAFLEHLIELRDRLLRIVLVLGAIFICLTPFAQDLYNWLSDPLVRNLPQGEKLIAIGVASPFLVPFKLALMVAFLVTLPYTFYQVWGFIAPGLYQHEKKMITPLLLSSVGLFYVGMAFAYFFVIPMISKAAVAFAPANVNPTPDIATYLDFTVAMFLAFGLSFETPVATILLIRMGIVSVEALAKARPYIIVGAFTIAMFLTPPDVVSQIMMAVPIWLLFEVGLFLGRTVAKKRSNEDDTEASNFGSTALVASAVVGTASVLHAGEDIESLDQADDTHNSAEHWQDKTYSFKEMDDDEFRPLTDEELEAELDKAAKQQAELDEQGRYAAGDQPPNQSTPPKD
ncbi:twin-arginine translocase subunit TatC [uncultured Thiothrix sp.]|uniref:twin-arginine translocase subunit TatC n=1 Tax=uncultured Thiothrix sp. TaxID=223185 RepID=UPI00261E2720|nr:twin-arginine translocase subunit TatC [uncultured Thiothrix sp.]